LTSHATEMVVLVDEHDNEIGSAEKLDAHEQGLLHRAFSVFIFRQRQDQIELLLQQRQQDKYHCGGLWTNTCCSHPRSGESIVAAAERRLHEEMGITAKLHTIGCFTYRAEFSNGLVEHEFDHTLVGKYDVDRIPFNPHEVQDYQWVTIDELQLRMQSHAHMFTPWLTGALLVVRENWALVHDFLFHEVVT
jgi:isopentenyl-diphosphate delta-isomerase